MSIHQTDTERGASEQGPLSVGLTLQHELYDLADTVLKARAIRALDSAAARYPICRSIRCATRRKLVDVFDDLALNMSLKALRLDEGTLLLDGPGVFVHADGRRKADYSSCAFGLWTESKQRLEEVRAALFRIIGDRYAPEQMFTIDWHFMNSRSGLSSASFDELATEPIHDEAYPSLGEPVRVFVQRYLDASETVLILQGPPGTGKTRLVRAILGEISKRKHKSANVMYTGTNVHSRTTRSSSTSSRVHTMRSSSRMPITCYWHAPTATTICIASWPSPTASCVRKGARSSSPPTCRTSATSTRRCCARVVASQLCEHAR
jgi:hypothetical protein